jgi:hypothetical protein
MLVVAALGSSGAPAWSSAAGESAPATAAKKKCKKAKKKKCKKSTPRPAQPVTPVSPVVPPTVNRAPAITSPDSADVAEHTTAVMTVTATDSDNDAATFSISGGADQAKFTINASSGALSFISAPNFESPTDAGTNNAYEVTVQASDGKGGTTTRAVAVTVTNVSEAPVLTSSSSFSTTEANGAAGDVTATDPEGDTLSFTIVGGVDQAHFNGEAFNNAPGGFLSFLSQRDFEFPADENGDNVYDVTVRVSDGNGGVTDQEVAVTVTNSNEPPVMTSGNSVSVFENDTAVTTVTAADPDSSDVLTFSIVGGADQAKFTINSITGFLSFNSAPDFEATTDADSDNFYEVTVQADDGGPDDGNGTSATQSIGVRVFDIPD